jgi:hypothetical protein
VWRVLAEQKREIKWLAERIGVPKARLYRLKEGKSDWWQHGEAVLVADALGVPFEVAFPPGSPVMPPGRRYPIIEREDVA